MSLSPFECHHILYIPCSREQNDGLDQPDVAPLIQAVSAKHTETPIGHKNHRA